jgi:DNA recombination protein RmuC
MEYVLIAIASVIVGAALAALVVYSLLRRRISALHQQHMAEAQARAVAEERNARIPELETQIATRDRQIAELQQECSTLKAERAGLATRLEEQEKAAKDKLALLDEARQKLSDAFKALSQEALKSNSSQFLELAKTNLDKYQEGAKSELEKRQKAIDELVKPLKESLTKVDDKLGLIEKARASSFAA